MFSNAFIASKAFIASIAALAVLTIATPLPQDTNELTAALNALTGGVHGGSPSTLTGRQSVSQCKTGPIQCCNSTQYVNSTSDASNLYDLVGVTVQELGVLVGMGCSPASVVGVGGNECSSTPVCCNDNSYGSLISIGCVPVIVSL